ncbi:MAG: von Willebrand factor type A domain-containing protein [Micrococcales bacterium]|nr:von Willebrand factor type A domain-containing protein [Micrococcales bacterium]
MSYPQTPEDSMPYGQEEYDRSAESPFVDAATTPLSTFSADVDTASYSNMRRQVRMGMKPDGVRVEELVNYFDYSYLAPDRDAAHPFSVTTEVAAAPWNSEHQLAMIGVQATRAVPTTAGNNIVFLIDVSGSMEAADKLPLLKDSFGLLVDKLGPQDVVSIVTYAGSDTIAADSVRGSDHARLKAILKDLTAGGSTAGAKGLTTAYTLATNNFITGGNNRVILATDGDFNVGQSSDEAMLELIEEKRASGVYISVLGFGMGNLKDRKMETIADHGNGNYAYIDTLNEAKKVLVDEFDSTMFVVAQDLKLQVEFNADVVSQYRLIGYDNRRLDDEDFADDTKDAGDVGAGHSVTAFYEIIPVSATTSGDYMTVSVRYKKPGQTESALTTTTVTSAAWTTTPSEDFAFASAVVEFGLVASDSQYAGNATARHAAQQAKGALGDDPYNLRSEFVELVGLYTEIVG